MPHLFTDIAEEVRRRVQAGLYPPAEPLPPERTLCEELGIHRSTLRRAIAQLEDEGIIRRSPGKRPCPIAPPPPLEGSIGCFVGENDDPFTRSIIPDGIVEVLGERGTRLSLVWSSDRPFRHGHPLPADIHALTGLVLWPPGVTNVEVLRMLRPSMPTVIVDAPVSGFESDFVGFDDEQAGYAAARHLYEQGHRRIAFVGSLRIVTARHRQLGFLRFLREVGLAPITGYEPLGMIEQLSSPVVDAFLQDLRATAFLCENDHTAAKIVHDLNRRGLRVPDDVALMGFGGSHLVLLDAIGLTTMEQPFADLGREAARMLLDRLEGRYTGPAREVRLPMKLAPRSSSKSL